MRRLRLRQVFDPPNSVVFEVPITGTFDRIAIIRALEKHFTYPAVKSIGVDHYVPLVGDPYIYVVVYTDSDGTSRRICDELESISAR